MKKINSPFFQDRIRKESSDHHQSPKRSSFESSSLRPLQTLFRSNDQMHSNFPNHVKELPGSPVSESTIVRDLVSQNHMNQMNAFHLKHKAFTLLEVSNWKTFWLLTILPILFSIFLTYPSQLGTVHLQKSCSIPFRECIKSENELQLALNLTSNQLIHSKFLFHLSPANTRDSIANLTFTISLFDSFHQIYLYQSPLQGFSLGNETFVHYAPSIHAANFLRDIDTKLQIVIQIHSSSKSFPFQHITLDVSEYSNGFICFARVMSVTLGLFLTVFVILFSYYCWIAATETYSNFIQDYDFSTSHTFSALHFLLPEQIFCSMLICACVLFLDPVGNSIVLISSYSGLKLPLTWISVLSFIKYAGKIGK